MRSWRDCLPDMHRPRYDDQLADRLLSGRLAPEDAPPAYRNVASLVEAATGPGTEAELSRESAVVAAAATTVQSTIVPLATASRRRPMLAKLLTAKVAAGAAVAAFGLGTAAAATGSLPGETTHPSHHVSTIAADPTTTVATSSGPTLPKTGPANEHAQFGLCTAFLNHNPTSTTSTTLKPPPSNSAPPFKMLMQEHGGLAGTTAYCQHLVTTHAADTPDSTASNEPADTNEPPHTGKPAGTGKPSDAGKPASPGKSGSHNQPSTSLPTHSGAGGSGGHPPASSSSSSANHAD